MGKLNQKLKGSTLVEVIIATIILSIIMLISSTVFINVFQSTNLLVEQEGRELMEEVYMQIEEQSIFQDHVFDFDDYEVLSKVSKYPDADKLYQVDLEVFLGNKVVSKQRRLISNCN